MQLVFFRDYLRKISKSNRTEPTQRKKKHGAYLNRNLVEHASCIMQSKRNQWSL